MIILLLTYYYNISGTRFWVPGMIKAVISAWGHMAGGETALQCRSLLIMRQSVGGVVVLLLVSSE